MTPKDRLESAIGAIRSELRERLDAFNAEGKLLEAQRLEQRTKYDLETSNCVTAMALRTTPAIWPAVRRARRRSA